MMIIKSAVAGQPSLLPPPIHNDTLLLSPKTNISLLPTSSTHPSIITSVFQGDKCLLDISSNPSKWKIRKKNIKFKRNVQQTKRGLIKAF